MEFYSEILRLLEIDSPLLFSGARYQVGGQLHLIVHDNSTFRAGKQVDSRHIHFAVWIVSSRETRDFVNSKGFHRDVSDGLKKLKESPQSTAGGPALYTMNPDRNVIELNAEYLEEA